MRLASDINYHKNLFLSIKFKFKYDTGRSSYSGKSNLIAGTDTGAGRKIGKKIGGVIGEKVGGESGKKIGEAVGEGVGLIIER